MTKRILSVLIVLCMALTFVPFVGSAATIEYGYLMIDSKTAASGEGWSWENGVLSLGQSDEFTAVMLSVDAKVVLTEDVTLRGGLVFSGEATVETGEYTLTVLGGINGSDITFKNSNVTTNSINSEYLNILDSTFTSDCSAIEYSFGISANEIVIERSVVFAASSMDEYMDYMAILTDSMTVTDSIVKAYGKAYGIVVNEPSTDFSGVLEINNSTIYADGGLTGIATSHTYSSEISSYDTLIINDCEVATPEYASLTVGSLANQYGGSSNFLAIADLNGNLARSVVIEAVYADELPAEPEFPEMPELPEISGGTQDPEDPEDPEEPEMPEVEANLYVAIDELGQVIIVVTAEDIYDRIALFYADDTSTSACLAVSDDYAEYADGFRQWLLVVDSPAKATEFVVKCRNAETKSYKDGREFGPFTIEAVQTAPELNELYVGGVNAFETPEGDGWYFDEETRTLVLDNCTLTQADTYYNADGEVINAVIYACGDLNIEFIGDNFIENHVEEIPEVATAYGAIWLDPAHNGYAGDFLAIYGEGNLTVGLAIEQEVYKSGLVEFSFAVYNYSEYSFDLTDLGIETTFDVYGGVVGVPAIYNVRPCPYAPAFTSGNKVTAYKNIEGTMLDENGYDTNDNEAWRIVIETTSAGIDSDGVLNIMDDGEAYGNGWSWENNVLTLSSDIDFRFVYFDEKVSGAKITLAEDVTLDATAKDEADASMIIGGIMFYNLSTLEIDTGDYTLTILNDRGAAIEAYGTLIIKGCLVADTQDSGWEGISVNGDLYITDAEVYSEYYGISVWDMYDYESDAFIGGNIVITNSYVSASVTYEEDDYGNVRYADAIFAYNNIAIDNSIVNAFGTYNAISANDLVIKNSEVYASGMFAGITAYYSMKVDNSTVWANGDCLAINVAPDSYHGEVIENAITLNGVTVFEPEMGETGIANVADLDGYEFQTNTIVDADGYACTVVGIMACNTVEYSIINGKLIITVVTEDRINRVALYDADGKCIKTYNSFEVDENGSRVWTIKMDAPTEEVTYTIKGRDAVANSYKKGVTLPTLNITPEVVIDDVETEVRGDKVYVTVTTVSDFYDRVAVATPDGTYIKCASTFEYDWETDMYVWKMVFNYTEDMSNLIVRARDIRTNRYNTAQQVEITLGERIEPVKDITITDYDEENILVTITTIPDLYKVKVAFADDATGYIAYSKKVVRIDDNGNAVWELIIARPEATTEYAVDIAYEKGAAYSRYFNYATYEVQA